LPLKGLFFFGGNYNCNCSQDSWNRGLFPQSRGPLSSLCLCGKVVIDHAAAWYVESSYLQNHHEHNEFVHSPPNSYADYTVRELYAFLSSYQLPRDVGEKFEYSNLGMGLLGHVLALRAGKSYEQLVIERILTPLGMSDSRITLTPAMRSRLAPGHNEVDTVVSNWDLPTLAGAGALGKSLVWHNGQTGGYHSFIGFDWPNGRGVVILANSSKNIDDIGLHLLDARFPLTAPPKVRKEIQINPALLDAYVGVYELAPASRQASTVISAERNRRRAAGAA